MIVLDTNVISEPLKPQPSGAVLNWLDRQVVETLFITATGLSELLIGVEMLPAGKRKKAYTTGLGKILQHLFGDRILAFDEAAARSHAPLVCGARAKGHIVSLADGQIAAIAETHGFSVATRDVKPFMAMGVSIINPWIEQ
jgi:predicted nucleic acid-binding protein